MKNSFYVLCCLLIDFSIGVKAQSMNNVYTDKSPAYILDGVRFKTIPIFDTNQIDSIHVSKDYDEVVKYNGRVEIKTKNPKAFNFITLGQVAKLRDISLKSLVFMLDGRFLKDTSEVRIDSSFVLKCILTKSSDFKYLKKAASFTIINVLTKNKENIGKESIIYIRGTALLQK